MGYQSARDQPFPEGLVDDLSCFYAKCILGEFGGKWIEPDLIEVNERLIVYPFSMVAKHVKNGEEDDIVAKFVVVRTMANSWGEGEK